MSVRQLARNMARDAGDDSAAAVESERRSLNRWLNEGKPATVSSRRRVARALGGVEETALDDDEEPHGAVLADLANALRPYLDRVKA